MNIEADKKLLDRTAVYKVDPTEAYRVGMGCLLSRFRMDFLGPTNIMRRAIRAVCHLKRLLQIAEEGQKEKERVSIEIDESFEFSQYRQEHSIVPMDALNAGLEIMLYEIEEIPHLVPGAPPSQRIQNLDRIQKHFDNLQAAAQLIMPNISGEQIKDIIFTIASCKERIALI